ncbi:MAG: fibronectin type III domain-containing protein [Bacteroidetes bacterium]|nr:fibronectin type III domain-containing protein [Bacteroidota bacterium]
MKKTMKKGKRQLRSLQQQFSAIVLLLIIKLELARLSVSDKIIEAREIVRKMMGNVNFPDPDPTLADVTTAIDALEIAEGAMPGGPEVTIIRNERLAEFNTKMSDLRNYVEFKSKGNREVGASSGMKIRTSKNPVGILPAPEWVKIKSGVVDGSVALRWKANTKSSGYRVEMTTDPAQGWPTTFDTEKANINIDNLTPGIKYYFRIATLSHAGYYGYSLAITFRPNFSNL